MIRMLLGLALALGVATAVQAEPASVTAYRGATLIDGRGGAPVPGMTVITRGERIEAVLPDANVTPAMLAQAKTVDLPGKFLLPGLIDSHQHIATPPNRRRAEALMRRDLYSGITATRIMADDLRSVAEIGRAARVGEIPSPDLYYAALMAGPSFFDDPRTQAVSGGITPGEGAWMQAVIDKTDLPLAIARAKGTGATAIKIYANLPAGLIRRITREAHRQGMQVWAHGMVFPTPPADVVAAGPDVISHTCYLAYQAVSPRPARYQDRVPIDPAQFADGKNPVMQRLFDEMRRRKILLDPTLRVYREGERSAQRTGKPPYCTLDLAARLTAQAHRAGIELSTGTDGDTGADAAYPGVFDEFELLVRNAGLSPAQVIRSATFVGAMTMGQARDMGTIEPGKLANMVVLSRDPTQDIANMRSVTLTVKRGRAFARDDYRPITPEEIKNDD
ncbi:MAG: amidohydrolase family protein [Sphingomonadales bacterium]